MCKCFIIGYMWNLRVYGPGEVFCGLGSNRDRYRTACHHSHERNKMRDHNKSSVGASYSNVPLEAAVLDPGLFVADSFRWSGPSVGPAGECAYPPGRRGS